MSDAAQQRLEAMIAASDEVLAQDGDSPDPVAQREVTKALATKAVALGQLGRLEDSLHVWDELIFRCAGQSSAAAPLIAARAALYKARALQQDGRHHLAVQAADEALRWFDRAGTSSGADLTIAEALVVKTWALTASTDTAGAVNAAAQLAVRFEDRETPDLRRQVAWALQHQSWLLLHEGRVEEALAVGDRLIARLADEPPESLPTVAGIVNRHSANLLKIGAMNPAAVVRFLLTIAASTAIEATGIAETVFPPEVAQARRRAGQALQAGRAVLARAHAGDDAELRRAAAEAELTSGTAQILCGHPRAGYRAFERFGSRGDTDAVQAFQRLTRSTQPDQTVLGQLGTVSNLTLRARMLGGGDPRIAQLAFDDSVADHPALTSPGLLTRLYARWQRPSTRRRRSA